MGEYEGQPWLATSTEHKTRFDYLEIYYYNSFLLNFMFIILISQKQTKLSQKKHQKSGNVGINIPIYRDKET